MFLKNKYTKLYFKLTKSSDSSGYTENHHIIPRCLGGSDDTTNIVSLSARKHFLCHYLLIKMIPTKSPEFWKLIKAFNMMNSTSDNQERYWNSRLYEKHRKLFAESMSVLQQGSNNSQYGTTWIYCPYTLISRKVPKSDLQTYLDNGYEKGRIQNINDFITKNKKAYTKSLKQKTDYVWIHSLHTFKSKRINKNEMTHYLNNGFAIGKPKKAKYFHTKPYFVISFKKIYKVRKEQSHFRVIKSLFETYRNNEVSLSDLSKNYDKSLSTMIYHMKKYADSIGFCLQDLINKRNLKN